MADDDEKCIITVRMSADLECPCGFETYDDVMPSLLSLDGYPDQCPECGRETEMRRDC